MHAWLHINKTAQAAADNSSDGQFHLVCDCLDEALMPLTESSSCDVIVPEKAVLQIFVTKSSPLLSSFKIFKLLRGPPAV